MRTIKYVALLAALVLLAACEQSVTMARPTPVLESPAAPVTVPVNRASLQRTITKDDASTHESLASLGVETQLILDHRIEGFAEHDWRVFEAGYTDDTTAELWINVASFPGEHAAVAADYAAEIGRTPLLLRRSLDRLYVLDGRPAGVAAAAGPRSVLLRDGNVGQVREVTLYAGWFTEAWRRPHREEAMLHELAHLALPDLGRSAEWRAAQEADGVFITDYAASFPLREDVADTLVAHVAVRHRRTPIGEPLARAIEQGIPARLAVLDAQGWSGLWCPVVLADCDEGVAG